MVYTCIFFFWQGKMKIALSSEVKHDERCKTTFTFLLVSFQYMKLKENYNTVEYLSQELDIRIFVPS